MSGKLGRVRASSFNPYEVRFPGRRVVSRDTLHLIKDLRAKGVSVTVEPEDETKLNWYTQKGFEEVLCPVIVQALDTTKDVLVGVFSAWLYDRLIRRRRATGTVQTQEHRLPVFVEESNEEEITFYGLDGSPVNESEVRAEPEAARSRAAK